MNFEQTLSNKVLSSLSQDDKDNRIEDISISNKQPTEPQQQINAHIVEVNNKEEENPTTVKIIDSLTLKKKKNISKKEEQNIEIRKSDKEDKTIFNGNETQVKLTLKPNECLAIIKYFQQEDEYQYDLNNLQHIGSSINKNITLPLMGYGKKNDKFYIEQQAGQKSLKMLKESFNQKQCFCKGRCIYCYKIDEYISYLFIQAFNKLNQLHDIGIAHSDIKPQNIVLGYDNQAYFIDFGCSVQLKDRQRYLQGYTYYYNLDKYFKTYKNNKGKLKHEMNFNFENENLIKQCDRSQLAITWLFMSFRTLEEKRLFHKKDYNNLLKSLYKRNRRNKLINLISRVLNEADSNIEIIDDQNNIQNSLMCISSLVESEYQHHDHNNTRPTQQLLQQVNQNFFLDQKRYLQILNYQKDITYEDNQFQIKRINEYSIHTVMFLNSFIDDKILNPEKLEIQLNQEVYNLFCQIYNTDAHYFLSQLKYEIHGSNLQKYSYLQYLKVAQDKVFEINFDIFCIDEFRNVIDAVQEAKSRDSLQIYLTFYGVGLRRINRLYQIIENLYPYENLKLIGVKIHQNYEFAHQSYRFQLVQEKIKLDSEKNNQLLIKLASLQISQYYNEQIEFQNYQFHLQEIIDQIKQKNSEKEFKMKLEMLQERLKWIVNTQKERIDQARKKTEQISIRREKQKKMSNSQHHSVGFPQRQFLQQSCEFYVIDNYQQKMMLTQNKIKNNCQENLDNRKQIIIERDIKIQFQPAQGIFLENIQYNLKITQVNLYDAIQKIKKFLNFLPVDQSSEIDIVLNNFVFQDMDFLYFILDTIDKQKQIQFKIRLIDCLFSQEVMNRVNELQQDDRAQFIQEDYDLQNKEYNEVKLEQYLLNIKFNQQQKINNYHLVIIFLCQYVQPQKQQFSNLKEQIQNNDQNKKIKQEQINKIVFEQQTNLQIDENMKNTYQIKTEKYNFIFNIQSEFKNKKGDISIEDLQEIVHDLQKDIYYDEIVVKVNNKASIESRQNNTKINITEYDINLTQLIFSFAFLISHKFEICLYITKDQYITITFAYSEKRIDFYFENFNDSICLDQEYLIQFFNIFKDSIKKDYDKTIEITLKQNMNDFKTFEKQFQLVESHFQKSFRRYNIENVSQNDFQNSKNLLDILYEYLKQIKEGILSFEISETQIIISEFIQFIEKLLLFGIEIGISISVRRESDNKKIILFLTNYFKKYTNYIEQDDFLHIVLFPQSPNVFIEFVLNNSLSFQNDENVIPNDEALISKLQHIYGQTSVEQSMKYIFLDEKFMF